MSKFKINSITDKSGYCGPVIAGVSTNNSTGCMIIPVGPTEHRGGRGRAIFGSGASKTRGVIGGGNATPAKSAVIDFITIASTGNATDFGDLVGPAVYGAGGLSDVHGGLG